MPDFSKILQVVFSGNSALPLSYFGRFLNGFFGHNLVTLDTKQGLKFR